GGVTQDPGSHERLWRGKPLEERMDAMRKAVSLENFLLRAKDIPAVIDQLEKWNTEDGHPLRGRMDLKRIGMSGHSVGATTTQAVGGQWYRTGGTSLTDPRIKAALAMSPSAPLRGVEPSQAFGEV